MIKKLPYLLASLSALFCLALTPPQLAYADTGGVLNTCKNQGTSGTAICGDQGGGGLFSVIRSIIQVLLIIAGIIAVIMIIIGGIRYTTSNGDQADVKAAKDTILYSVVGLVVTIAAYSIVTWVIGQIK